MTISLRQNCLTLSVANASMAYCYPKIKRSTITNDSFNTCNELSIILKYEDLLSFHHMIMNDFMLFLKHKSP